MSSTTSLYLIPPTSSAPAKFTTVVPESNVRIFARGYGDTNSLDTVIQMLQGLLPELAEMRDLPCAIRLDLVTP